MTVPSDLRHEPWFAEALGRLGGLRGSRVIQIYGNVARTMALLEAIGGGGHLLVLEPNAFDAATIEESIDHDGLHVVAYRPDGDEVFGQHDALVASPMVVDDHALNRWAQMARANLRPGGRFVFDLPGVQHCSAIADAWHEIGAPEDLLAPWNGPSDSALARVLRAKNFRQVEGFGRDPHRPLREPARSRVHGLRSSRGRRRDPGRSPPGSGPEPRVQRGGRAAVPPDARVRDALITASRPARPRRPRAGARSPPVAPRRSSRRGTSAPRSACPGRSRTRVASADRRSAATRSPSPPGRGTS